MFTFLNLSAILKEKKTQCNWLVEWKCFIAPSLIITNHPFLSRQYLPFLTYIHNVLTSFYCFSVNSSQKSFTLYADLFIYFEVEYMGWHVNHVSVKLHQAEKNLSTNSQTRTGFTQNLHNENPWIFLDQFIDFPWPFHAVKIPAILHKKFISGQFWKPLYPWPYSEHKLG